MNILDLENKKNQLVDRLSNSISSKQKALLISFFLQELLESKNQKIFEAFIFEFIEDFLDCLEVYDPFCLHPKYSNQIINLLKNLSDNDLLYKHREKIKQLHNQINLRLKNLEDILDGNYYDSVNEGKTFFPVLEKQNFIKDLVFGNLESLTIRIEESKSEDKFIISPREIELESRIDKQVKDSWSLALDYCRIYTRRIGQYHKVFIHYDRMQGVYIGDSLGIALTLGFIEQLLKLYNAPTIVGINDKVAFTGRIDDKGNVQTLTQKIIKDKIVNIFFSPIEIFVIPRNDENYAIEKVIQLKKEFPKRKLEIVGVNKLNDLLNRRDLVNIRKQNPIIRSGKAIKKNSISFTFAVVLIVVIIFSGLWDFDYNPTDLFKEGTTLYVKNKNGKILWTKKVHLDLTFGDERLFTHKIVDINKDGINEIILCAERYNNEQIMDNYGRIVCYNNKGDKLWSYLFEDSISTYEIDHSINYVSYILDTITIHNEKVLLSFARNSPLYPNAIYKLDIRTGERIDSTNILWHAGGITSALLGDFDENGTKEIVGVAIHNGYERAVLFSIDIDKLYGQSPASTRYTFKDIPIADFNSYILLPKTDYNNLFYRYNCPQTGSLLFYKESKEFMFIVLEGIDKHTISFNYRFTNDLKFILLDCGDDAQLRRDSLVSKGVLNLPFTNTSEYFSLLKDQIRYWDGEKFVKKENLN